ncbi:FAD binding domain-containing protein [Chaetomidium leptoderma]|uniref:FAD binding domain-containing protein n=1 Tax=Chaetomidium leptoderma TaxID=669021 RepID=A0AAN6ZX39_9PEZI|nr:FAD binding domain-containing protein [Chaetomidium leptoderma]
MASPSSPPVIVVGAGLAGLSAAYSALQAGAASVRLLERAAKPGGNSIKASSGINGAPTRFQNVAEYGVDESFWDDTVRSAGSRLHAVSVAEPIKSQRQGLISVLTNRSTSAIDFLVDDLGVDLSVVAQLGGHSKPRTHRGGAGKTPPGASIVTTLLAKLNEYGGDDRFELMTKTEVTKLLLLSSSSTEEVVVTGVEYRPQTDTTTNTQTLHGPVIFTTGGFAGDTHGLLAQYRPDLAGLPSTNDPRPGTAHTLLAAAGARLVDMESVQVHPTGFVDPANPPLALKFLAAEMLRGEGGILLYRGRRVVNELDTRERVSEAIMGLPLATASAASAASAAAREGGGGGELRQWDVQLLLDPGTTEAAAGHVGFYLWKGLLQKKKVRELDEATRETLREYASVVRGEKKDGLGRVAFGHWKLGVDGADIDDEAEVCVGWVTPVVHFTMGGAVINEQAQILASELGEEQRPIQGLWGAGEVTGGIHGDNRLGGSSLLECVVFGRIAGEQAARATLKADA